MLSSFTICIIIALWTIIQSAIHLAWLMMGNYMYTCKATPNDSTLYLIYLTYFYRKECAIAGEFIGHINENAFCDTFVFTNPETEAELCNLGKNLNLRGMFPNFGNETINTKLLIDGQILFTCFWIISAVALLMGTIGRIKEVWSVCFYYPWLVITALITILDVLTAWKFAKGILAIKNVSTYLNFIGVVNYEKFENYDGIIPRFVFILPSIILSALSLRLGIFLILNVFSIVHVLKAARAAYTQSFTEEKRRKYVRRRKQSPDTVPNDMNLDTSAARIRNWQLFYGSGQSTNETLSSKSTINSSCSSNDLNSNSSRRRENNNASTSNNNVSVISESSSRHVEITNVIVFDDPENLNNIINGGQRNSLEELRGQLPWSYDPSNNLEQKKKGPILKHSSKYVDTADVHSHRNNKNLHY